MDYKIENNVAMPSPYRNCGRAEKYPWSKLEVGQSFFAANIALMSGASHAGKRLGKKFTTRKMDGGVRVWRVE